MKRYRIGNDIHVNWKVKKNGSPADLGDKQIVICLTHEKGRQLIRDITIEDDSISFVIEGQMQTALGKYTITLDARYTTGKRYLIQDKCGAFELVARSCIENTEDSNYKLYI